MTKKQSKLLIRFILSACLTLIFFFIPFCKEYIKFFVFLPYLIIAYDVLLKAGKGILHFQPFDENFLMCVATIGAYCLGEYLEAVCVMLFYQLGELFQSIAVGKSRKNIASLMDIRPDVAYREINGGIREFSPEEIEIGTEILVRAGEKIPLDGIIISGNSSLNTSALTGESLPKDVAVGDEVYSGSVNLNGVLTIKTTKNFENSTVSKILDLVENALSNKSKSEVFISKFSKVYTPAVCISALLLAVVPPLITLLITKNNVFSEWIYRALTFLVISCPCALVISIPLTFFASLGGAGSKGILIKGSNYLETLSKVKTVVFDKTGTLTKGKFSISNIQPENDFDKKDLLYFAGSVEKFSNHPIALAIKEQCENLSDHIKDFEEIGGYGLKAIVDDKMVLVGNQKLLDKYNVSCNHEHHVGTTVYVAVDGKCCGKITINDMPKEQSKNAIQLLKKEGIEQTVMLSGDHQNVADKIGNELGIDSIYGNLLPQDKVSKMQDLLNNKNGSIAYVGDGINDAPVLALSDVGIAMGAIGSDAAVESADVVLMDDNPLSVPKAIKIAKKAMKIVYENIIFSIGVKLICLILSAFGLSNMWMGVVADVGVMILAVLNAIRSLHYKE